MCVEHLLRFDFQMLGLATPPISLVMPLYETGFGFAQLFAQFGSRFCLEAGFTELALQLALLGLPLSLPRREFFLGCATESFEFLSSKLKIIGKLPALGKPLVFLGFDGLAGARASRC